MNRHIYKNGFSKGYAAEDFNDAGWEDVTLPHDWCFGLEQDPEYDVTHGHYKLNIADQMCMDARCAGGQRLTHRMVPKKL